MEDQPAGTPVADEQLTVPEDREAAQAAEGQAKAAEGPPPSRGRWPARAGEGDQPDGPPPFELLSPEQEDGYRARWAALQAGFVDDPKSAADQADALVGEVLEALVRRREELRGDLGRRFDEGADTEAMRLAIQHYRVFFNRLSGG
jgi:hypothetical protein